jgi:hypothetical protein
MLRSVLCAIALAGILAGAYPAFADCSPAPAPDYARAAAPATGQPASPAPAWSPPPDTTAPVGVARDKAPVGFGWG